MSVSLSIKNVPNELASRAKLSACDAAYLWLALALGAPLATFDAKLGAAARRELRGA